MNFQHKMRHKRLKVNNNTDIDISEGERPIHGTCASCMDTSGEKQNNIPQGLNLVELQVHYSPAFDGILQLEKSPAN